MENRIRSLVGEINVILFPFQSDCIQASEIQGLGALGNIPNFQLGSQKGHTLEIRALTLVVRGKQIDYS